MDRDFFESFLKELSNILAGRVVVRFNEVLDCYLDIGLPENETLSIDKFISEVSDSEVFIYKMNMTICQKNISVILFVLKNNNVKLCKNLFDEFFDDFTHTFSEIVETMCFDMEYSFDKPVVFEDYINTIIGREFSDRAEDYDYCNFVYNNIFEKNNKYDVGGMYLFY